MLSEGAHSADVIINIPARQRDPGPAATILTPDALRLRTPQSPTARDAINSREEHERGANRSLGDLKLYGMRSTYDETLATAIKRKHEPQRFVGDLLKAEISEKQARSIK